MFNSYSIGVTISLMNQISPGLSRIITDLAKTDEQAHKLQKRLDSIAVGFKASLGAIGAGVALASPFKAGLQEAEKFERALLRLKMIGGIDAATMSTVRSDALSGKFAGIGPAQQVDMFRDLHAAFGDKQHAMEFMPQFAAIARISETMYGKNIAGSEADLKALARVAERRGGTKSVAAMDSSMDLVTKILIASGGAVTPKDIQQFGARMGASFNTLSNEGLLKEWALMQEMGGSQAGTSMASALQNLAYGRGSEASGMHLRKYGMVDEAKNAKLLQEHYGDKWVNHRNKIEAGAIKGFDQLITDKMGWIQDVFLAQLKKSGVTSEKDIGLAAALMLSNRRGADDIALSATQLSRILKDYQIAVESKGYKEADRELQDNPVFKLDKLKKDWERALTNLGEAVLPTAIKAVNQMSDAFKWFNTFAEKNPGIIQNVTNGFLGLSAVLIGGGVIGLIANTVKSFILLKDVMLLLAGRGAIAAATTGLSGIALAAGPLAAALGPAVLGIAALVAAVAGMAWILDKFGKNPTSSDPSHGPRTRQSGDEHHDGDEWVPGHGRSGAGGYWRKPVSSTPAVAPYHRSSSPMRIQVDTHLDGRKVGQAVTEFWGREARRPMTGGTRPDGSMMPVSPGMTGAH